MLGWLGSVFYPIITYLKPPKIPEANIQSLKVGKVDAFPANSSKIVQFGRDPVIVVLDDMGNFNALGATCTHLDCIVQYRPDSKSILCACHNGIYDLKGRNISGPPPRPLQQFDVKIVNEEILISKPDQTG